MSWHATVWPAAQGQPIYISNYNELVAGLNERDAETYGGGPFDLKAAGDWVEIGDIVNLRSRVEDIIPYFTDPTTGEEYTKASCLTAAIGVTDWTAPALAQGDWIQPVHYNELKAVLDVLSWLKLVHDSFVASKKSPSAGGDNSSWATAWSNAKTAFAGSSWISYASGPLVGFKVASLAPGGTYNYYKNINHWRTTELVYTVPDYTEDVIDTKFGLYVDYDSDGGSGDIDVHVFDQDDFGGNEFDFTASQDGNVLVDVNTVTKDTVVEYSYRTDPESPDPDNYAATNSNGALRGASCHTPFLLVRLGFTYLTV